MWESAVIIANPAAGRFSNAKIKKVVEIFASKGIETDLLFTTKIGHAQEMARDMAGKNPSFIAVAGGDGTVNEVINGVAGSNVPVALLPAGTANVLAEEVGIPKDFTDAAEFILKRKPRPVSLGKIETQGKERYFCLMAGMGYDAAVVHNLSEPLKKVMGRAAYVASGIFTLLIWGIPRIEVEVGGETYHCHTVIACNSGKYAGNYEFAPGADISEPYLNIVLIEGNKRVDLLKFVLATFVKKHTSLKFVKYIKSKNLTVKGETHIQLDGDYFDKTPASISKADFDLKLIY